MSKPRSLALASLGIVASAFASALAFPPFGVRPLAFVCLVPLLIAIRSGGLARAIGLSVVWCLLYASLIASVFPPSVARYFERPLWFGVLAGLFVFSSMAGVYYAAFAACDRALTRRPTAFTPLLVAAAWVFAELGRGRLFTGTPFFIGNPWGLLGYTHASGPLAQFASVAGVYGIGFTLVAVNAGLAGWIGSLRDARARRTALAGLGLSVLPVLASAIHGSAVLRAVPPPDAGDAGVEVAIIQGDVSIDRRWRSDFHGKNLDLYLQLTHRALREGSPRLVIWPETAMNFFVESEPRYLEAIEAVLQTGDEPMLLAGGPSAERDERASNRGSVFHNSVFAIDPRSGILQRYDKQVLVPFSEHFPAASLDWMRRQTEGVRTFEPGPSQPSPLDTPLGRAGILICNEAMLPEIAGDRVRAGAEFLVSPSHDGWIAGRAFGEHMLAVVSLRAVEQRRSLLRASTSGPSAIVDPWGRVIARTDVHGSSILAGFARPNRELTPYARFGDAFALACGAVVVGALVVGWIRGRSRQAPGRLDPAENGPRRPNIP